MELEKYDFESALEQGFKALFDTAGLALRVADDMDEGKLPDECITLEINTGGPISDEHLNSEGVYDNYGGSFEVTVKSNRIAGANVVRRTDIDAYEVTGAGSPEVYGLYVRNGDSIDGKPAYSKYVDGVITHSVWSANGNIWILSDTAPDDLGFGDNAYQISSTSETPPEGDWGSGGITGGVWQAPFPTLTKYNLKIRNRHNELVARTRKALEEIDASALSTNWPGALSPTKIKPTGTERENDNLSKMTTLSYELQFRIT